MAGKIGSFCMVLVLLVVTNGQISAKRHVEFKEEPTDILVLKNRPAELRCKVSGDGNTKITWLKDGASLNLAGDTRRTILADGTLKFSYIIRKKNNSDEGQYQCVASTDVKGFTFRIVSQKAKVTVAAMSRAFAQKPSDLTVNEGETAFFRCQPKRSRPPAKITWSMEGKNTDLTLNPRFVVLPSGILEIRSVMASDAGAYVCKATNEKRRKSSTAKAVLIVKRASAAPVASTFIVRPQDTRILHNKDLTLECIVKGYPLPRVTWFKDGQQITLTTTGRYVQLGTHNLKVSSVQPGDTGRYECVVGSQKAVANVQVIVPPRFTKPPIDVTEVEGNDVKITCDVTGHPSPTLSWYYNGKLVVSRDYITIKNNSLTVMEALDTDQGIYQCFVANDGGEIQGSAQLTVLDEDDFFTTSSSSTLTSTTQLPSTTPNTTPSTSPSTTPTTAPRLAPSAPKNVVARALNTTSVAVSWQPPGEPHGTIMNYTLLWKKRGKDQPVSMTSTTHTVHLVNHLNPGTTYSFYVYATNQYLRGFISEEAEAQTQSPTPPTTRKITGPPRDVKVEAMSSEALRVTWREPALITDRIQNYSIVYQDVDRKTPAQLDYTMKLEIVLLKLQPYTRYSVKVTALNINGRGKTSTTVLGRTKSGIPKGPPENVQFDLMNKVLLVAQWEKPSQPNGNITGYRMMLRNETTKEVKMIFTKDTTSHVFTNLEMSTKYSFKVAAETEAGRGVYSSWISRKMPSKPLSENKEPGKPTNLQARVIQRMVEVKWDPPKEKHIIVRGYKLTYGKGAPGHKSFSLAQNVTSLLLKNLQPGSIYVINVRAVNKKGPGQMVYEKVIIPDEVPKTNKALYDLRAIPTRNKVLELSWNDKFITSQPVIYRVEYEKDGEMVSVNTTHRFILVEDLKPGTTYKFDIKRNDQSKFETVSNTTKAERPSAPKDVTFSIDAEHSHTSVQWNIPDEPNGQLTNYEICWKPKGARRQRRSCKLIKGNKLNYRISGMKPDITYIVRVRAVNEAGKGNFSDTKEYSPNSVKDLVGKPPSTGNGLSIELSTEPDGIKGTPKVGKTENGLTSNEKTLWIIIAVIAAVTLIAIVVISVILCKKRSEHSSVARKKLSSDPYKAVANGSGRKKTSKDNYWIKQNETELQSLDRNGKEQDSSVAPTIPRIADEMKPLDSPFQSRKDHSSLLMDESDQESLPPMYNDHLLPSSFNGDNPSENSKNHEEPYQLLPKVAPKPKSVNIYSSPFTYTSDDFPSPPPEVLDNNKCDDGPATSSDYGSEEIVVPSSMPGQPPVSYIPKKASNGYVSVATDYDYPSQERPNSDHELNGLQNLMRDLEAITAKEDRV